MTRYEAFSLVGNGGGTCADARKFLVFDEGDVFLFNMTA